jgi:antitoxin component YwqK of YwqJK toxin-antitoxin module
MSNIRYKVGKHGECDVIIVLTVCKKNNEIRNDIIDPDFAKYRCKSAKVMKIYNLKTNEEYKYAISSRYKKKTLTYIVDEIITDDDYDEDIDVIQTSGIHYYKTENAATTSIKPDDGDYITYLDNGAICTKYEYKNGRPFGEIYSYHVSLDNKIIETHMYKCSL